MSNVIKLTTKKANPTSPTGAPPSLITSPSSPKVITSSLRVMCFDPGTTIGYAIADKGKCVNMSFVKWGPEFFKFLNDGMTLPDVLIIENYRIRPPNLVGAAIKTGRLWESPDALKVIGALHYWWFLKGRTTSVVMQEPVNKSIGYKLMSKEPLPHSNPLNHALDAWAHILYYFHKRGELK